MTSTEPTAADDGRQRVLDALAALWQAIRRQHEQVPAVRLTWGTARRGRAADVAHLRSGAWSGTLTITDETTGTPFELFCAVLHEAAHALAAALDVSDTSNRGQYHTQRYAELAAELGLEVREHANRTRWGWAATQPAPATTSRYAAELDALRAAVDQYVPADPPAPAGRGRNPVVAVCGCTGEHARPIRISPAKLALGPITCGVGGQPYRERDASDR